MKVPHLFPTLLLIITVLSSTLIANLASPPVYGQTTDAWNIHRQGTGNDLNFYYGLSGLPALQLNTNGQMRARAILDLDSPTNRIIDPSGSTTLNSLTLVGALTGTTGTFSGSFTAATGAFNSQGTRLGSAAGNATAPTPSNTNLLLYHNSATNWAGIGSWTDGSMYFVTGTSSPATRLFIANNSGNVGIGTTAPQGRLDIQATGDDNSPVIRMRQSNSPTYGIDMGIDNNVDGGLIFHANNNGAQSVVMDINRSGNVGIGTAQPLGKLHVSGLNNGDGILFNAIGDDRLGIQTTLNNQSVGYGGDANVLALQPSAGVATIGVPYSWTPRGRLSVGSGNGDMLNIYQGTDDAMDIGVSLNNNGHGYGGDAARLRLMPHGGVIEIPKITCIQARCPQNGAIRMPDGHLRLNAQSPGGVLVNADSGQGGGVTAGTWQFAVYDGLGANKFVVTAGGTSYCAVGCIDQSDERLKKDINTIPNALDKVLALRGVNFHWDSSRYPKKTQLFPETQQMGFIAQQIESVIPEVVVTDQDGFKSVDYGKVSALLVEGVKEQQKQIENERSKNEKQEEIIKKQQEEIDQLKEIVKQLQARDKTL